MSCRSSNNRPYHVQLKCLTNQKAGFSVWTGTRALELSPLSYHGIRTWDEATIIMATNYTVCFYEHLYKSLLLTVIYICTFESHAIKYLVQWAGVHKLKQVISMVSSCMLCPTRQSLAFSSRTYIIIPFVHMHCLHTECGYWSSTWKAWHKELGRGLGSRTQYDPIWLQVFRMRVQVCIHLNSL